MKKILAALMALTLSISLGATIVNAASTDQTSQETLGTESVSYTHLKYRGAELRCKPRACISVRA